MKRRQILAGGRALALAGAGVAYAGLRPMGSMEEYDASVAAMRATLSQRPEVPDLIRFATLAPNGHNTQPWRFRIGKVRWSRPVGQFSGRVKLGSGCRQAASLSVTLAPYASSGVRPANVE